jgi:hypothetical protein
MSSPSSDDRKKTRITHELSHLLQLRMNYPHWHYYRSLVDDLDRLARYVELCEDNFGTYSLELTRLFLSAGSEIDVVAKLLCERVSPESKCRNIIEYRDILVAKYPGLTKVLISMPRYGLSFTPWEGWDDRSPQWWTSYNNVKHERHKFFQEACLANVLASLSALCVFVCYLHQDFISEGLGTQRPSLFLDPQYNKRKKNSGRLLVSPYIALPDFDSDESIDASSENAG